ncbi:terminase small subunit [Anoxybacterium hadale]|uniref:Terminase small subunit n=1 Tax=Anoxybacterium hadale TaxID=3408580 RepID=A0ACD1ADG0_9FIRM|nr:terminase small subunit [Clostridiales bacterium]
MARLTVKQQRFVDEYLIDSNATQAAIRAGYSTNTAEQLGYQQLQNSSVRARVDEALAVRSKREIKFADKLKALELLGKHLGMFMDNVKLTGVYVNFKAGSTPLRVTNTN